MIEAAAAMRVAPEPAREGHDALAEPVIERARLRLVALRRASLPGLPACPPLAHPQRCADVLDRTRTALGAQKLPSAVSPRIAMSSCWSATTFFSRAFSPTPGPSLSGWHGRRGAGRALLGPARFAAGGVVGHVKAQIVTR